MKLSKLPAENQEKSKEYTCHFYMCFTTISLVEAGIDLISLFVAGKWSDVKISQDHIDYTMHQNFESCDMLTDNEKDKKNLQISTKQQKKSCALKVVRKEKETATQAYNKCVVI